MTKEQKAMIAKHLGDDAPDDSGTALEMLVEKLESNITEKQNLSAEIAARDTKITELSRERVEAPLIMKPDARDVEICKMRCELSRERGDITKHMADGITKLIDSEPLMLSRESDGKPALVLKFLELFDGAKLGAKSVEKTGIQALSREVPDGSGENAELPYKKMAERYNATA